MFCTNCGSQFEEGNAFCPNCGSKVESVAQPVAEPAPVATPVEAAPVAAAPVESAPVDAVPVAAAAVAAAPVEAAPVQATPVEAVPIATPYEPAPAPAPAPNAIPVAPVPPMASPVQPVYASAPMGVTPIQAQPNNPSLATNILVMGIIAVATACTVWFGVAGIIFGAIGLTKAKKFTEECGQLFGKAKVGKYLSLGGLIAGCVVTAYVAIYLLAAIATVISEMN